jgi:secreted PhoX family phosphatase
MELSLVRPNRRDVLRYGFAGLGLMLTGSWFTGCANSSGSGRSNIDALGPLGEPDANGVRVPEGFQSRILARSGELVAGTPYTWHGSPDGGATFATDDGGWIYVSNSELVSGGVGALRFDRNGTIIDAYSILRNSVINCAGGPTPWGTWLTCEEFDQGRVWECDPYGREAAVAYPALGIFVHEAVAVDPVRGHLYLTEDRGDGRFYRFTPEHATSNRLDLSSGLLEVAQVAGEVEGAVTWLAVPDPSAASMPTRVQVPQSTAFRGGEGIWYHAGVVYFATKGDNRVWAYDTQAAAMHVLYDDDFFTPAELRGVDNIVVSAFGDVLVAEDGDNMQIVAHAATGVLVPLVQIVGHPGSEVTGPAFDPSGTRLYFSSQRGATNDFLTGGVTYEVCGPFLL